MSKVQFNRIPTFDLPLITKGKITNAWFSFWAGLASGTPTGDIKTLLVPTSPATLIAPSGGTYILSGGSVTGVQISRDAQNFFLTGQTSGMFPVSQGDQLVVHYSTAPPTVQFAPK